MSRFRASATLLCAWACLPLGCREAVTTASPSKPPVAAPSASASAPDAPLPVEDTVAAPGSCWGTGRAKPDELLLRVEARCAVGMKRVLGPAAVEAPARLPATPSACYRVAVVGRGRVEATLSEGDGAAVTVKGDGVALLPSDGPLCSNAELTVTVSSGPARVAVWRVTP